MKKCSQAYILLLNETHFFLYLHGIFPFWYNQSCISLFHKKDDALNQSFIFHTFLLLIHSFVLIFSACFLFKTYFCWKSYLKPLSFFFSCFFLGGIGGGEKGYLCFPVPGPDPSSGPRLRPWLPAPALNLYFPAPALALNLCSPVLRFTVKFAIVTVSTCINSASTYIYDGVYFLVLAY